MLLSIGLGQCIANQREVLEQDQEEGGMYVRDVSAAPIEGSSVTNWNPKNLQHFWTMQKVKKKIR